MAVFWLDSQMFLFHLSKEEELEKVEMVLIVRQCVFMNACSECDLL